MGFSGISIGQLLLILLIVLLIFGGKRLKNLGGDFGNALKGFRKAMHDHDDDKSNLEKKDKIDPNDKKD
jgi:sec-independent protein translocase protein TatA